MQLKLITTVIVILLVVVSLSITGCTSSTTSSTTNTNPDNKVNVTAKAVASPQQFGTHNTPRPGNKYVLYNVTFTNINAPNTQVSGYFSFALLDTSNNVYTVDQGIQSNYLSQAFPYGYTTTQPGDKISGRLVYEVPQNAKLVTLRYHDYSGFDLTVALGSGVSSASSNQSSSSPAVISIPSTSVTPTPAPSVTPTTAPSVTPTPTQTPTTGFSVLFFYEPGCPHCANLENSASFAQLQNKVSVQWISNADTQLNNQYGVSGYPTMILLKNGVEVQRFVGDEDATAILARINTG